MELHDGNLWVSLSHESLVVDPLIRAVGSSKSGAINVFIGTTRDTFEDKIVKELFYESYESMAAEQMMGVCKEIQAKWPGVNHVAMQHKLGACPIGEISVIIAVAAGHRREAIEACHYGIDRLKEVVPIWKKEIYEDGEAIWKENAEQNIS